MKRSAVLEIVLLGVLRASPAAAQQAGKTYRVGILTARTPTAGRSDFEALRRALSSLGYREGKNLEIVYRAAGGDYTRLPELAADLVRSKPDVIVAASTPAVAAAIHATTSVPIVMAQTSDPVGAGFIASLGRPGGNITGLTNMSNELVGKQLQLLKELVPRLQRVVVIGNRSNSADFTSWRAAESAARRLGITIGAVDIRTADRIDVALRTFPHLHSDAVLVLPDPALTSNAPRIVRLVAEQRLPAVYSQGAFTTAGGLMFYGGSLVAQWSRAATYVDRILKGAKPADLPVERPRIFELIVNLKAAHQIGIAVPKSILLRADQVIR